MKKLYWLVLVLALCAVVWPATAGAASSGTCGDNLTWTLDDAGVLTISGTGKMTNYSLYTIPWYSSRVSIKTIIINNGVTSIGAFNECSSLTSVTIPASVSSIGDYAFQHCSSLSSINIPNSVTSIGKAAFSCCTNLTSINIPDGVTSISDNFFDYCSSLTSIVIPDSVTSIGDYAFQECTSLTSINVPDNVTSVGYYAFSGCTNLSSISIPNRVTSIRSYTFSGCSNLMNITIPDSVKSISGSAFQNCSKFSSVTVQSCRSYAYQWAKNNSKNITVINHTVIVLPAIEPTCTEVGYTKSRYCIVCGEVFSPQEEIPATGHTVVEDVALDPTCTEDGRTAGTHCAVCGEMLEDTRTLPALGHDYHLDGQVSPAYGAVYRCGRCGDTRTEAAEKYLGLWKVESVLRLIDGRVLSGDSLGSFAEWYMMFEPDGAAWVVEGDEPARGEWRIEDGALFVDERAIPLNDSGRLVTSVRNSYEVSYARQADAPLSDEAKRFIGAWVAAHIYETTTGSATGHSAIGELAGMKIYIEDGGRAVVVSGGVASNKTWTYADGVFSLGGQADALLMSTGGQLLMPLDDERYLVLMRKDMMSLIYSGRTLTLPAALKTIEPHAFENVAAGEIVLPEGIESIGSAAFVNCAALRSLVIPSTVTSIAPDALVNCPGCVLVCVNNDYAVQYAFRNRVPYFVP